MPLVTLVMANGPGFPQGSAAHRYELDVALTPGGYLDDEAWRADPRIWPATRAWPGGPPRQGDVQWDDETGWSLSIYPADGQQVDAPRHALMRHVGQLRPGEYVTLREPEGIEYSYRVVSVG